MNIHEAIFRRRLVIAFSRRVGIMSDRESGDEQQSGAARAESGSESGVQNAESGSESDAHQKAGSGSGSGEQELATRMLNIETKRFYLDVKQNKRGRFIKIAEVGAGGKKSRLLLAMSTAAEFRDYLTEFGNHYTSLGPAASPEDRPEDGKLKSEMIRKDNRRYYLDLKENQRGRFLKVSQVIPRTSARQQIVIPAQGLIEFRNALTDLLLDFGEDDHEGSAPLPESRSMRVENKIFYFDVGSNRRGVFMRISEVRSNFRTAITIPERSWGKFRDIMSDFVERDVPEEKEEDDQEPAEEQD